LIPNGFALAFNGLGALSLLFSSSVKGEPMNLRIMYGKSFSAPREFNQTADAGGLARAR
jgi:hypothetical protein